jgi:hypothetical protein
MVLYIRIRIPQTLQYLLLYSSVADPYNFDPDPTPEKNAEPDPDPALGKILDKIFVSRKI